MNTVIYSLLNKINEARILDEEYLESLWQYYIDGSKKLNYEINIHKNDFKKLFSIIYDVLKLKIDENKCRMVLEHYLKLLMADASIGWTIDISYSINYVWYLCVGISNKIDASIYRDSIIFIQQKLVEEFNIEETLKEKVSRKIYTKYMSKC